MENNLLIVGAGIYGTVAQEIASEMGCFGRIDFIDDFCNKTTNGKTVICTFNDAYKYADEYKNIIVAIGNSEIRKQIFKKIIDDGNFKLVTLKSPKAYISPSAQIEAGCIIEPMAVIQTGVSIKEGCIISAGAVINHGSICKEFVHVDCNATVKGSTTVPQGMKIESGQVFANE